MTLSRFIDLSLCGVLICVGPTVVCVLMQWTPGVIFFIGLLFLFGMCELLAVAIAIMLNKI